MKQSRRHWLTNIGLTIAAIVVTKFKSFALPNNNFFTQIFNKDDNMNLGAFSVSLNVKDITASKQFYETPGFKIFAGDIKKNFVIMKNDNSVIGLFHGMFEKNILTFNPGWDENANKQEKFDDVREIQRQLKSKGIKLMTEADDKSSGPASFTIMDQMEIKYFLMNTFNLKASRYR